MAPIEALPRCFPPVLLRHSLLALLHCATSDHADCLRDHTANRLPCLSGSPWSGEEEGNALTTQCNTVGGGIKSYRDWL